MADEKRTRLMRFGEVVDALIAKDYTARGISHELYEEVREQKGAPLAMASVMALAERIQAGDRVMIFTGWPSRSWLIHGLTETDGPVGAAILARALEEAFGIIPILVMERSMAHFGEVALRAAGLIGNGSPVKTRPAQSFCGGGNRYSNGSRRSAGRCRAQAGCNPAVSTDIH